MRAILLHRHIKFQCAFSVNALINLPKVAPIPDQPFKGVITMATKKIVKKVVAKTTARAKPAVRKLVKSVKVSANKNPVKKAVLVGLGAAERMQKRVHDQTTKIVGGMVDAVTKGRFSDLSNDRVKAFAKKANLFVTKGVKMQSDAQAAAQAKALEVLKEMKTLAAKSEKAFKKNVKGPVDTTMASAKDGIVKLEHVFEARVARTLNTFGIPSSKNVRDLQARMADLQKALVQLNKRGIRA
jgi:hypothetical protein